MTDSSRVDRSSRHTAPSPPIAAFLSFIFPGLGQAYERRRNRALLFAVPVVVLLLVILIESIGGVEFFAAQLIDPAFALAALVVIVVLGIWRLASMWDAYVAAGTPVGRRARGSLAALLILVVGVGVMHGVGAYYAWAFYDAGSHIFQGGQPGDSPPPDALASQLPGASDNGEFGSPGPSLPPPTADRVTFLLTGVDSGHNRDHALTDTLLVVSVNKVTKTAVMLSVPRDISNFPMYNGGTYYGKINSLLTAASLNPGQYPDGGVGTLTREIGYLIGVPVNYYAAVNLVGFQSMVDLVGGVDVVNPKWINDPSYDWFNGTYGFTLSPGPHHLDGVNALAYVRTRKGIGDSDFTRAARQQQVLVALRAKMGSASMLTRLPAILQVASTTIRTDFPSAEIRQYLLLAKSIPNSAIQRVVLGPPYSTHPPDNTTGGIYILKIDFSQFAAMSVGFFGSDSRYYTGPASGAGSSAPPSAPPSSGP